MGNNRKYIEILPEIKKCYDSGISKQETAKRLDLSIVQVGRYFCKFLNESYINKFKVPKIPKTITFFENQFSNKNISGNFILINPSEEILNSNYYKFLNKK